MKKITKLFLALAAAFVMVISLSGCLMMGAMMLDMSMIGGTDGNPVTWQRTSGSYTYTYEFKNADSTLSYVYTEFNGSTFVKAYKGTWRVGLDEDDSSKLVLIFSRTHMTTTEGSWTADKVADADYSYEVSSSTLKFDGHTYKKQ